MRVGTYDQMRDEGQDIPTAISAALSAGLLDMPRLEPRASLGPIPAQVLHLLEAGWDRDRWDADIAVSMQDILDVLGPLRTTILEA